MKEAILQYLALQKKLFHFEVVEQTAKWRAKIIFKSIVTLVFFTFLFFSCFGVAMLINDITTSSYIGFLWIALVMFMITLLCIAFKKEIKKLLENDYQDRNIPE